MLLILYTLSAAALVARAASSVSVSYPLDDQLPPIARIHTRYSWSFQPNSFVSDSNARLVYTTSALPGWLSFDSDTLTFSGTPSADDEGTPKITVTASDPKSSDSASSSAILCVTPYPAPELHIPIEQQFDAKNPSLSSVFVLSNSSSLRGPRPALRVPPKWSFSIGFDYDTFAAKNSLYYAARQLDGSPLPRWVKFNERAITFDGVTPPPQNLTGPHVLSLVLHASDQKGYSASSLEFDLVVAAHDFSLATNSLPTINVTAGQDFRFTLNSAVDFSGVLIDGQPVSPSNITSLDIDTSDLEGWLRYDPASKTLSGEPPSDFSRGVLPVILTSSVNQTLTTDVKLAAVPSFFSSDNLDSLLLNPGEHLNFHLAQFFSNSTGLGKSSDVELTAAFDPLETSDYLTFSPGSSTLEGTVPANVSYPHIAVTFTAYSHITHSTSHTTLPISLSVADYENDHTTSGGHGLSAAARHRLLLGLKIAFGVICGFVLIAVIFAVMRRCSHVPDSADTGEDGRRAWTAEERRWYGIGIEVNGEKYSPPPTEGFPGTHAPHASGKESESGMGAVVSRVLSRTLSNVSRNRSPLSPVGHAQSPPMMRKVEFLGRVRATARVVSDKYRRVVSGPKRPVISKPTLLLAGDGPGQGRADVEGLPFSTPDALRAVGAVADSPSLSPTPSSLLTDARSIPRRRADFAPPLPPPRVITTPPEAHMSMGDAAGTGATCRSLDTLATESSTRTHEQEAVVQRATRATSVRSGASGYSFQTEDSPRHPHHQQQYPHFPVEMARPRLVPFTSATRVPVPKLPSSFFSPDPAGTGVVEDPGSPPLTTKRVVSQMAKVFRGDRASQSHQRRSQHASPIVPQGEEEGTSASADELRAGIEYVRALGDDGRSSLSVSQGAWCAVTDWDVCADVGSTACSGPVAGARMLARTGERFKFRVPVAADAKTEKMTKEGKGKDLEVRLVSGRALPKFFRVNLDGLGTGTGAGKGGRVVDLWGVPVRADVGEYEIGVYGVGGGECVGRVVVEVVERKSG
ncbi:hypothetical protein C8Q76DRAFT_684896 [Earliella scabrosa]|nr:hypothetical protein C8Q76DRAFT_684896 [Earliella scabrosa]